MFKLYSKGCEYALRALSCFSPTLTDQKISPTKICKNAKIPRPYTQKVFQLLVQKGFLASSTGPKGGYSLLKDPKEISLLEIVQAVDGEATFDKCVMGLDKCNEKNPCPMHFTWGKMKKSVLRGLKEKSLFDVMSLERLKKNKVNLG